MWGRTHLERKTIFLKALKVYSAGGTADFISSAEMLKRQRERKGKKVSGGKEGRKEEGRKERMEDCLSVLCVKK